MPASPRTPDQEDRDDFTTDIPPRRHRSAWPLGAGHCGGPGAVRAGGHDRRRAGHRLRAGPADADAAGLSKRGGPAGRGDDGADRRTAAGARGPQAEPDRDPGRDRGGRDRVRLARRSGPRRVPPGARRRRGGARDVSRLRDRGTAVAQGRVGTLCRSGRRIRARDRRRTGRRWPPPGPAHPAKRDHPARRHGRARRPLPRPRGRAGADHRPVRLRGGGPRILGRALARARGPDRLDAAGQPAAGPEGAGPAAGAGARRGADPGAQRAGPVPAARDRRGRGFWGPTHARWTMRPSTFPAAAVRKRWPRRRGSTPSPTPATTSTAWPEDCRPTGCSATACRPPRCLPTSPWNWPSSTPGRRRRR